VSDVARTLLQLVQAAVGELGQLAPTSLVSSTDPSAVQWLALANREGAEFSDEATPRGGWQELRVDYTFNTSIGVDTYNLPADFGFLLPNTLWDVSKHWQVVGSLSQQEWNTLQYGISPAGPRFRFKIGGGVFMMNPAPSSVISVAYSYVSNGWCKSSGGVSRAPWGADTDTYKLDEDAFIMGLKWRYLQAKGFAYDDFRDDYRRRTDLLKARNASARTLPLNSTSPEDAFLLSTANVPDTGFGI
jgi:hypothetical protein